MLYIVIAIVDYTDHWLYWHQFLLIAERISKLISANDVFHPQLRRLGAVLGAVTLSCVLSACAVAPPAGTPASDNTPTDQPRTEQPLTPAAQAQAQDSSPTSAPPAEEDIIYGNFSEDVLSRSIIAELSLQRGHIQQALDEYVALARETDNLSIIKRTMRIAGVIRNNPISLEMGERWLKHEPDSADARQMLAVQLIIQGRYREAVSYMSWLQEHGEDMDFRLIPSRTLNDNNAELIMDALISDFEELATRFPETTSIRQALAMLYQQNEQTLEAYNIIKVLAVESADAPEIVLQEVQLLEIMGDSAKAQQRLEQSLRSNPQHKQLRFLLGRKLIDEKRYKDAKEQFTIIVEQDPQDYDMLHSLALLSLEVNMLADARSYLERLVKFDQKLDDAHYYLGYIDTQEGNPEQAIEHYYKVHSGSNFLAAQRNLTELMINADRYNEIHAHLQNIRFRNADYNIPLLGMEASLLVDNGKFELATGLLNSAIGAFPNNIQLLFQRSVLSQERNDLALMETDLRKIILLNPGNPVAYNSLGYTLADRTDRYQEAYELIQKAIELAPNDPAIIDSLGWVQYRLGLYDEAKTNLTRAYALFPDPEVAAHLGEVLWVSGDKAEANRIWRNALKVEPESQHVLNAIERLNPGSSI